MPHALGDDEPLPRAELEGLPADVDEQKAGGTDGMPESRENQDLTRGRLTSRPRETYFG